MDFNEKYIKKLLPKRSKDSHKGTFGHVLNIAGSEFYSGAAYFSSIAALKVGAGRSTLSSGKETLKAIASLSPDIILLPFDLKKLNDKISDYNAISIGCGLSTSKDAIKNFKSALNILKENETPVVIDADGLNILATVSTLAPCGRGQGEGLTLPPNTIMTPHPLELSRLLGVPVETIVVQPDFWAQKCTEKFNCITVLKGHNTAIAAPDGHLYINNTGNTALSKGGSGDVLTGMITGFIAQDLKPLEASVLAVYLHGKTGELASKELTEYSVLASDLIKYIPLAISNLT